VNRRLTITILPNTMSKELAITCFSVVTVSAASDSLDDMTPTVAVRKGPITQSKSPSCTQPHDGLMSSQAGLF
jgi:hypothetical protein